MIEEEHKCPVDGCDYSSKSKRGVKMHCGKIHSVENNPYKIQRNCMVCGNCFTRTKSQMEQGAGKYCSKECQYADGRVECECDYCNKNLKKKKQKLGRGE